MRQIELIKERIFMKKLILMLSMVFSLFMSMSVFAAGDYSIGGASWDTGDRALATWDEAEDKTKYKVQLYKGNKKIGSNNSTSAAKYDFTKLISDNGVGNYSFKVYPLKGGPDMTIESESEYFDSDAVAGFKKSRSSNTSNNSTSTNNTSGSSSTTNNGWYQSNGSWYYRKADGTHATNWFMVNNLWYYFDANGVMQTGWITDSKGFRYYLNQPNGDMPVGWALINNKWYYFDESGLYRKGWIEDKGLWYYLDANGEMVTNTTVDGYNINADGVLVK